MQIRKLTAVAVALAVTVAPMFAASAAPLRASSSQPVLAKAGDRVGGRSVSRSDASALEGGSWLLAALAAAAVIAGIVVAVDGGDEGVSD